MRVLFVSTSQGGLCGGGERYLQILAEALAAQCGVVPEVAMSRAPCMDWLAEGLGRLAVPVHRLGMRNLFAYRTRAIGCYLDPRNRICVARLIRSVRPDIIHVNQQNVEDGLDVVRTAQVVRPGRVVGTIHNAQILRSIVTRGRAVREWWASRFHRRVPYHRIFVSAASRRSFEQAVPGYAGHNHVVLNGLPLPDSPEHGDGARLAAKATFGLSEEATVIGYAGRLTAQKDLPLLLQAFALIAGGHAGSVLLVAGEGEEGERLRQLARRLGIEEKVKMPGYLSREGVEAFYRAIDVFVLPSRWEGLPFVLVEASLRGVPAIATAVDGNVEALDCGRAGMLVPPESLAEMAEAMSRMIRNGGLREEYSRKGMAFAHGRLTAERMAQQTFGVYQRVVADENTGSP